MMKKLLYLFLLSPLLGVSQTNVYNYGFSSPTATMVSTDEWIRTNQSSSPYLNGLWRVPTYFSYTVSPTAGPVFQNQEYNIGQTVPIPLGQAGGENSFVNVDFTSTTIDAQTGATISNWLISPIVTVQNGDIVSFYTRHAKASNPVLYADRLQLRMSANGAESALPSAGFTDIGDFTNLLVDVNPNLTTTGYPSSWTQYNYIVTGLSVPTNVKFAFRYFVTDGGIGGTNSNQIGIDTFSVDRPTASTQDFFANHFSLYPNPVKSTFTLTSRNGAPFDNVSVTDINGRIVSNTNFSGIDTVDINVANLMSGVYFVKVKSDQGTGTTKIVKN